MKLKLQVLLFCLLAAGPAAAQTTLNKLPSPPEGEGFIYFTADRAQVEPNSKKINLQGDVTIIQETKEGQTRTIKGQDITLDQINTRITSLGLVTMDSGDNHFEGTDLSVNYVTKDFSAKNIATEYPPLRVLSTKEISSKDGKQILRNATLTCCDANPPHYTMSVGKLTVSPEKRVFGTNAVLKLDGFPIFYLPLFWRSLDSQKSWTTYIDFTQSGKTGWGLLTSTVFKPTLGFRPKLNLDFYTKSGVGIGGELMAITTPTLKGTGEFYFINDQANSDDYYSLTDANGQKRFDLNDTKRWGVRGGYWWEMLDTSDHFEKETGALYQFQTQFRKVSDPYFNDSFFRGNPYIFMPDQEMNFALGRQSRTSTLRISYTQKDIFDWDKGEFMAQNRTLPKLEFSLLPFRDPLLKASHRLEANFNNTSIMEGPYRKGGNARWTSEKSFRLGRNLTFLPSVFYDQTVRFKDENYNDKDAWVGRIGTDLNLQTRTPIGTLDFGYQYTKRLSTGTIQSDRLSADHGEERNRLYLENYYRPTFNTYVRFGTGFNLSEYTASWDHLKSRIDPILLEVGYNSPNGAINLFAQNLYDLEKKNQAFIMQSYFTVKGQVLGLGMTNYTTSQDPNSLYQTHSDKYTITSSLGLRPASLNWTADFVLDFEIYRGSVVAFNKLARVMKKFHDASLELTIQDRNENLSFAFRVNILCGEDTRDKQQLPEDRYWYPWRGTNDLR